MWLEFVEVFVTYLTQVFVFVVVVVYKFGLTIIVEKVGNRIKPTKFCDESKEK